MNLEQAKDLLIRTHVASLKPHMPRANGYFLQSGPGLGKSQSINQYCKMLARRLDQPVGLVVMMLASITSPDVRGFMYPQPVPGKVTRSTFTLPPWYPTEDNTTIFMPDGTVHLPGMWEGEVPDVGVLFLDEWGQAEEDVRKPAAELVLNGNVGTHRLPGGWRIVAAQNRLSDRSGVIRELMHIVNRRALLEIEGSSDVLLRHIDNDLEVHERPHYLTTAFIRKAPDVVFRGTLPDTPDPYATPRSLFMMDRDLRVLQTDEDIEHDRLPMTALASELCASFIGKGAAAQFFTHIRFAEELPDLGDILASPRTTKVPPGQDAQMICAYYLVENVNEDTAKAIVTYVLRLSKRMQILAMGMMAGVQEKGVGGDERATRMQLARAKAVTPLPEFTKWMLDNKDIMIAARM